MTKRDDPGPQPKLAAHRVLSIRDRRVGVARAIMSTVPIVAVVFGVVAVWLAAIVAGWVPARSAAEVASLTLGPIDAAMGHRAASVYPRNAGNRRGPSCRGVRTVTATPTISPPVCILRHPQAWNRSVLPRIDHINPGLTKVSEVARRQGCFGYATDGCDLGVKPSIGRPELSRSVTTTAYSAAGRARVPGSSAPVGSRTASASMARISASSTTPLARGLRQRHTTSLLKGMRGLVVVVSSDFARLNNS